jgi:hypothetical protein
MAIVAPPANKAAVRPIRADLVMIFSKPICPGERTSHGHWLFPKVCNSAMKPRAMPAATQSMQSEAVVNLDLAFADHFGDQKPKTG